MFVVMGPEGGVRNDGLKMGLTPTSHSHGQRRWHFGNDLGQPSSRHRRDWYGM